MIDYCDVIYGGMYSKDAEINQNRQNRIKNVIKVDKHTATDVIHCRTKLIYFQIGDGKMIPSLCMRFQDG